MSGRNFKNKEEDVEQNMFTNIDKSTVLQEARIFHETPINPKKCCNLLTKILYLIYQGEPIATKEATEVFFAITKLFQSQDTTLRRMMYLVIKELSTIAEDVIIVTSSLQKDMGAKTDPIYKANAIRVLCKITDSSLVQGIERFIKQAVVDKAPAVSSAALVSANHMFLTSKEVVKRWTNEVQEASNSKSNMVQFHALGLLYQIRQKDKMAVSKLLQGFAKAPPRSPHAQCMVIRYAVSLLEEEEVDINTRALLTEHLDSCLRHKSEMVVYEAARAICCLKSSTIKELSPAISVLQLFLSSPKQTLRFAAIRTLNRVSLTHPYSVSSCNLDMENLITDANRSISTLAITTLLKTGNEASVDRLMKQIESFMSEISDEFKVVVVEAIRTLCVKFPSKQNLMLNFLAAALREEGGFTFKKAIVDSLITFATDIPDAKEFVLGHLCEFIEDCEHAALLVDVLHLLGKEGPRSATPSKYIRYIYNRVILESPTVRAAATTALAKFGVFNEELRPSVLVLLKRCTFDNEDEVRDRASFHINMLEKDLNVAKKYLTNDNTYSITALEKLLSSYNSNPEAWKQPFDPKSVPLVSKEVVETETRKIKSIAEESIPLKASEKKQDIQTSIVTTIPELAHLGPLLKSSKPIQLTETETEYNVSLIKHLFNQHIVLQYICKNTLNDQILENVTIDTDIEKLQTDTDIEKLQIESILPIKKLSYGESLSCFVCFKKEKNSFPLGRFENTLNFLIKDCDPETQEPDEEGYEDTYPIENFDIGIEDYMVPSIVGDFKQSWDSLGDENQVVETFQLSMNTILDAVNNIIEFLGMQPCEKTGPSGISNDKNTHVLLLSGNFLGTIPTLVRCRLASSSAGVTMEIAVRSTDSIVSNALANTIA